MVKAHFHLPCQGEAMLNSRSWINDFKYKLVIKFIARFDLRLVRQNVIYKKTNRHAGIYSVPLCSSAVARNHL